MTPIISVENLSKRYIIDHQRDGNDGLRHRLEDAFRHPFRRLGARLRKRNDSSADSVLHAPESVLSTLRPPAREEFWALKDVSFEIKQGDVVGIIGRNGAGKSTLLKVLSRITEPTKGRIRIKGRVASLLEVGTGFHQELTGRENIYLNGAILGMTKSEIQRKFDEIVTFSEIEKFLDTPVKRYSSGMYVRLAFAVAAHLEPEILIVDEVLAVGDAQFQKRCLGKMQDVSKKEGRTVLFVSHNMVAVQNLCARTIWLNEGRIIADGAPTTLVNDYLKRGISLRLTEEWDDISTAPGNEHVRIRMIKVRSENEQLTGPITMQTPVICEIGFWNLTVQKSLAITLHLKTEDGTIAFGTSSVLARGWQERAFPRGYFLASCHIPGGLLNSGVYRFKILVVRDHSVVIYEKEDVISFEVKDSRDPSTGWYGRLAGVVRPELEWNIDYLGRKEDGQIAPGKEPR
jgi:lipopolysaccharide transport system ATP-binding protein